MTFTDQFTDMLTETITAAAWVGMSTDGYANTTYSTDTTDYACRSVTEQKLVRNFDGEEVMSMTTVWVASTSTFSATDQFTLAGVSPPLLTISTYRDEYGINHSTLRFGV